MPSFSRDRSGVRYSPFVTVPPFPMGLILLFSAGAHVQSDANHEFPLECTATLEFEWRPIMYLRLPGGSWDDFYATLRALLAPQRISGSLRPEVVLNGSGPAVSTSLPLTNVFHQ